MKKFGCVFLMGFVCAMPAFAQQTPTFQPDADVPNLGRGSTPLSSLVLTPPPLPAVIIGLDNSKPAPVVQPQPKPEPRKEIMMPREPSKTIAINEDVALPEEIKQLPKPKTVETPPPPPKETVMPMNLDDLFAKTADVTQFSISGFKIGMTPDEILSMARTMGWKATSVKKSLPLFREAWYEEKCREKNTRIVEDINRCISKMGDDDGVRYVNEIILKKGKTKESVSVLFTSNATGNMAYKVYYQSLGDNSLGFTPKNMATKLRRKEMFWNQMFETYGYPDDADLILWGDLQKSYMQATMSSANYDAYIAIEDKEIQDTDYFAAEDAALELRFSNPFTYNRVPIPEDEE